MSPRYGYWNIRGRSHQIRQLLGYLGLDYQNEFPKGMDEWQAQKPSLGLDFPNLPYYIDGDFKLTETGALVRYFGRKADLCGATQDDAAKIDMISDVAQDIKMAMIKICFSPEFDKVKGPYVDELEAKLKPLAKFLGEQDWVVGNRLSTADFVLYECIYFHNKLAPEVVAKFPNFLDHQKRFEAVPKLQKFLASDVNYKNLLPPFAAFGGNFD